MAFELRHLRAFVAVAEELNFTRAAERLHMAQQALSRTINQLEQRLGVQLFERSTRKVALTPAGEALLQRAGPILDAVDRAAAEVRAAGGTRRLTVGLRETYGAQIVARALHSFAAERPDVEVETRYGDILDPSGGLRGGDADVSLVSGDFDDSGLELLPLWSEPLYLIMSADHPLAEREELTLADMSAYPTLRTPTPDRRSHEFWTGTRLRGQEPDYVGEVTSLAGIRAALRGSVGVQIASRYTGNADGLVHREVPGIEPLVHSVAWRSGDDRSEIRDLIAAIVAAADASDQANTHG
jgi:DNA-binding transcriptional LysR family regulator